MRRKTVVTILVVASLSGCKGPAENTRSTAGLGAKEGNESTTQPQTQPQSTAESHRGDASSDLGPGPWIYGRSIGGRGEEPGEFSEPVGLAVDERRELYVSDAGNKRLQKLDATGESLAVWAEDIGRPMHLEWSTDGRLIVPVFVEDRVRFFDGTRQSTEFGGEWLDGPAAVVQRADHRFYVADFFHHQVHIVSPDGERLQTIGEKGTANGQFTYPTDIALDANGDVWVADAYAHRLQRFDPEGNHVGTVGGRGTAPGRFDVATGIDIGPDGRIYVADFENDRVQILQSDGSPLWVIESDAAGDESLARPTDVVATDGRVYIVDHGHHQIDVWDASEEM